MLKDGRYTAACEGAQDGLKRRMGRLQAKPINLRPDEPFVGE